MSRRPAARAVVALSVCLAAAWLCGCNVAAQSYNHGKLLNPGESIITTGFGQKRYNRSAYVYHDVYDSVGNYAYRDVALDTQSLGWFNFCLDYRLGFLDKYPFGKGLEIGVHSEMMVRSVPYTDYDGKDRSMPEFQGPPILEFSARTGLPGLTAGRSLYHHNVGIGWTVGYWVDNGWQLEYAGGWELARIIPYASVRLFLTATDPMSTGAPVDSGFFTTHHQRWCVRLSGGASLKLPVLPVLPDFVAPEFCVFFPRYTPTRSVGVSFSLGLRWMNGI